jgi:hypothetical protein
VTPRPGACLKEPTDWPQPRHAALGAEALDVREALSGKLLEASSESISFRERMCESDEALGVGLKEFSRKLIFSSHGIA